MEKVSSSEYSAIISTTTTTTTLQLFVLLFGTIVLCGTTTTLYNSYSPVSFLARLRRYCQLFDENGVLWYSISCWPFLARLSTLILSVIWWKKTVLWYSISGYALLGSIGFDSAVALRLYFLLKYLCSIIWFLIVKILYALFNFVSLLFVSVFCSSHAIYISIVLVPFHFILLFGWSTDHVKVHFSLLWYKWSETSYAAKDG